MTKNGRPNTTIITHGLYQVRDNVAEMAVGPILKEKRAASAIRAFHSLLKDNTTTPNEHPADYDLIYIGEQDEATGEIAGTKPIVVDRGKTWAEEKAKSSDTP